jgi:hypothetical protein
LRFAHAFVISILFGKGTIFERFKWALRMALNHGTLLAIFAFTYKTICCFFRNIFKMQSAFFSLIGGFIGAKVITSNRSKEFGLINR